jgi:hypothetical protein
MKIFENIKSKKNKIQLNVSNKSNNSNSISSIPAFDYLIDKYGLNCDIYRNLSSIIHKNSVLAANEFSELIKQETNDVLAHFFFDILLSFYILGNQEKFYGNKQDKYSAIIEGIHFKYYGNISNVTIESILQLWASNNECFFKTTYNIFKKGDIESGLNLLISIASNCSGKAIIGATEIMKLAEPFKSIIYSKLNDIETVKL